MGFETDIERMYRAGKTDIPNAADRLSRISTLLFQHLQTLNGQAALAGDPAIMRSMLEVGGDLYDVLRGGVVSLNHCASAVIKTADDYVRTDADARRDFARLDPDLKGAPLPHGATPPPELRDPEAPGATVPAGRPDGIPDDDTNGGTVTIPSTPDPVDPDVDAKKRDEAEDRSEYEHEREKRRG
jgi:hypothetical protein